MSRYSVAEVWTHFWRVPIFVATSR